MRRQIIRITLTLANLALVFATIALAQSSASPEALTVPSQNAYISSWEVAQQVGSSKSKIFVVTLDQPQRKQTCRIQSFTKDKLACSRQLGHPRTFLPKQILALILPGDHALKLKLVLGFNAGSGAAIWGTVVFAATCPACAVATGIAAFLFFDAAVVSLIGDEQPDRALYVAAGQQLTGKLRFIQSTGDL